MPGMPRRSLLGLATAALLIAGGAAGWAWRAPAVPAVSAVQAPLVRTLQFSARVATASRVEVGSTLTGRVLDVAVSEGTSVRQGDLLLRLEDDELRAALAQAQASERQATARLAGLRSSGRRAASAAVTQAESVRMAAAADLQRNQDLVARGFVSASRLDEARRALSVAQAQLDSAQALNAANAEQGTDIHQAQAQLAVASATTAAAQARLAQTRLTAPADARVLARLVEPGQIVQPGRALLNLALAGPQQLVATVDERYLEQLQVGQAASVLADAFPGQRFGATILSIAPIVDAQRGAVEVKFSLPQAAPAFLREDMTLSVEVETARRAQALVVPLEALSAENPGAPALLRVARDGRVEERPVRLGLRTLQAVEVLEGLTAGELVLLGPTPPAGSRVKPEPIDAQAARSARPRPGGDAGTALSNAMGR
jgi:HlyD family secretion protein